MTYHNNLQQQQQQQQSLLLLQLLLLQAQDIHILHNIYPNLHLQLHMVDSNHHHQNYNQEYCQCHHNTHPLPNLGYNLQESQRVRIIWKSLYMDGTAPKSLELICPLEIKVKVSLGHFTRYTGYIFLEEYVFMFSVIICYPHRIGVKGCYPKCLCI